jgi:hypothetical protein
VTISLAAEWRRVLNFTCSNENTTFLCTWKRVCLKQQRWEATPGYTRMKNVNSRPRSYCKPCYWKQMCASPHCWAVLKHGPSCNFMNLWLSSSLYC